MYLEHFKLSDKPFNNCPSDGFFVPNEGFESAITRMEQVLLSRDAVAVITGGPGVGKTTIVSTAAKRIEDKTTVVYIDMRLTDPELLFDLLLLNLGGESGAGDLATSLYRLKSILSRDNNEQGRKITAVIDVSSLTIERAKRILQLVHMTGEPEGQLNIVLIGPHILHKLLDTPGLIHMRQRVTFRYRARPLTVAETGAYLESQLERSGGQPDAILDHGAAIMAYQFVGGVPRLINTLMDATLSYAAANNFDSIAPNLFTEAAKLLGWRKMSGTKSAQAATGATQQKKPAAPATFSSNKQDNSWPAESVVSEPLTKEAAKDSSTNFNPEVDNTASLMAAALDADTLPKDTAAKPDSDSDKPDVSQKPEMTSVPAMDASDTSATGMLRLEDLDARFAETVFGEDPSLFKLDVEKATG
jgi:general secretion pathway protein A